MVYLKNKNKKFRQKCVDDFLGGNFGYNFPKSSPSFFGKILATKNCLNIYISKKKK